MLFLLCSWAVLLVASRLTGATVLLLTSSGNSLDRAGDRFFAQFWVGLLSLASVLLAVSLFAPLKPAVSLAVVGGAAALAFLPSVHGEWKAAGLSGVEAATFAMVAMAVAWNATGPVELWDTGLYHYQMVCWLAQAGTAPGMALLHFRFGFSSSWFALSAVFDAGPWQGRGSAVASSLVLAVGAFQLCLAAARVLAKAARRSDAYLAAALPLVFLTSLLGRMQVTPSPDLPAAVACVLCGWALMARREQGGGWNLPILLAGGAAGVKAGMLPLLGVVGAIRLVQPGRRLVPAVAAGALLAGPAIVANRVSSGCPLFPSPILCAATPSSVSPAEASKVSSIIANWARYGGPYPRNASLFDGMWIKTWIRDPLNALYAGIALAAAAVVLALGDVSAAFLAGAAAWLAVFAAGPSERFLAGPVNVLCGCLAAALYGRFATPAVPERKTASGILLALTAAGCALLIGAGARSEALYARRNHVAYRRADIGRLLLPAAVPNGTVPWVEQHTSYFSFRTPVGDNRCWALPLPCTPYVPAANLGYCRPAEGLAGGFCLQAKNGTLAPATK